MQNTCFIDFTLCLNYRPKLGKTATPTLQLIGGVA